MPHHHAPRMHRYAYTGTGRRAHPCRRLHLLSLPLSATAHQRLCFIHRRSSLLPLSKHDPPSPRHTDLASHYSTHHQTNAELVQFRDSVLRLEGVACEETFREGSILEFWLCAVSMTPCVACDLDPFSFFGSRKETLAFRGKSRLFQSRCVTTVG